MTTPKDDAATVKLTTDDLSALILRAFVAHGVSKANARILTRVVVAAEQDGCTTHGVFRMSGYIATLRSGWVDGKAQPQVTDAAPGLVLVDAANGFSQVALDAGRETLLEKVGRNGIASLAIRNGHHFAALWPDIEPFAEAGYVALTMVNGRSRIAPFGARRKVIGTTPMAFACPRKNGPPVMWDQASSIVAQGEVLLASREGGTLPPGIGVDAEGRSTTDPKAVLAGGALLPFGGHKGSAIALMIELLAGALTGSCLGVEDRSAEFPGAETSRAGQLVILVDPGRLAGADFAARVDLLLSHLTDAGVERLPGDRRRSARQKSAGHVNLRRDIYEYLASLGQHS
jgi:delta1-piperideine-2-carboxylate reductase